MVSNKHVFWQAFLATIVIFGLGLILGFFIESFRADNVQEKLLNSEISLADEQLRNRIIDDLPIKCSISKNSTFSFADKIYEEAQTLEQYDSANNFQDVLEVLHRRYDLLRMLLWTESIKVRESCNSSFHTIVYLYNYQPDNVKVNAEQGYYAHLLLDIKKSYPDDVLLIPIAANMDLSSVDMVVKNYGINKFPAIIIDENETITRVVNREEIDKIIFKK